MYFDNPEEFAKRIIEDLENLEETDRGESESLVLRKPQNHENVDDSTIRPNKIEIVDESHHVMISG